LILFQNTSIFSSRINLSKTDLTPTELLNKVERILARAKEPKKFIKKRVLIIEDEKEIARLYQERLTKEGFETEIANNGAWGLKLAAHGDFDIILLDMVMPVMDGYEVLKQIKKDLRTQKVPVLVFSNSAQDEEIAKVLEMGARDYFLKSKMTPAQVVEEVKNVLKE